MPEVSNLLNRIGCQLEAFAEDGDGLDSVVVPPLG